MGSSCSRTGGGRPTARWDYEGETDDPPFDLGEWDSVSRARIRVHSSTRPSSVPLSECAEGVGLHPRGVVHRGAGLDDVGCRQAEVEGRGRHDVSIGELAYRSFSTGQIADGPPVR